MGYIYVIRMTGTDYYKVGYAVNPARRMAMLQVGNPADLELVDYWEGTRLSEAEAHQDLQEFHVRGEWFRCLVAPRSCDGCSRAYVPHVGIQRFCGSICSQKRKAQRQRERRKEIQGV